MINRLNQAERAGAILFLAICFLEMSPLSLAQAVQVTQKKVREAASETYEHELFTANMGLKEKLASPLFEELKITVPNADIDGTRYYFVEGDRRLNEDELLVYSVELQLQFKTYHAQLNLPLELRLALTADRDALVSEVEGGGIVRWRPGSRLTYRIDKGSFMGLVDGQQKYLRVVEEFTMATRAWMSIVNASVPQYEHRPELDGQGPSANALVTFTVRAIDLPGTVIASAFFPNDPRSSWHVFIDPQEYFSNDLLFDRVGVLRHELGHTLGFRHEHPRSEAPLACQTLEAFEGDEIPLGAYDPVSVMHYFCRGFNNPEQEELNSVRRKLELTDLDKRGTTLVYPPDGQSSGFQFVEFDPTPLGVINDEGGNNPHTPTAFAAPRSELWREPQDSAMAVNDPDLYAWKLFVALTRNSRPDNVIDQLLGRVRFEYANFRVADEFDQFVLIVIGGVADRDGQANRPLAPRQLQEFRDCGFVLFRRIGAEPVGNQNAHWRTALAWHLLLCQFTSQKPQSLCS
jgi:predicted Zn-dependent protease